MSESRRLITALTAMLCFNLGLTVALELVPNDGAETVRFHLAALFHGRQSADSWKPMEIARAYAASHRAGLYEAVFFQEGVKFQYPPTSLLFIGHLARPALNTLSRIATLTTAVLTIIILRIAITRDWPDARPVDAREALVRDGLVLALGLTFYPLLKAYSLGQIQSWLDALFAVVVLAWSLGARAVSGIAFGAMCLIKPTYGPFLIWAVWRRQTRFVASAIGVIAGGLMVSVWRYGWQNHVDYLRVLSFIAQRGEAFYANQSVNGLLNRLLFHGSNLRWLEHGFPTPHPIVIVGTVAASIVLLLTALVVVREASAVACALFALTVTMAAPVVWEHHYGVMLPSYAVVLPPLLAGRRTGRWVVPALAFSYVAAANFFQFTNRFAGTRLNPLQSYLLAAALVLLALLYRGRRQQP